MKLISSFKEIKNNISLKNELSGIEIQVIDMTCNGLDSIEIAKQLNLSPRQVDETRLSIYKRYVSMPSTARAHYNNQPVMQLASN
jgi:DNA-binding NarL/FixJ family response regulator